MAAAVIGGRSPPPWELYCTPPAGSGAAADVMDRLVDDFLGDGDAGVAAAAESLHLGDRRAAFVVVAAVLGADVAPAAGAGLRRPVNTTARFSTSTSCSRRSMSSSSPRTWERKSMEKPWP